MVPKKRNTGSRDVALHVAHERFGYHALRPGRREAIDFVLAGRDVLAVVPAGAGKPAIYRIPAVVLPGRIVVDSLLIALRKLGGAIAALGRPRVLALMPGC